MAPLTKRTIEVSLAKPQCRTLLTVLKKKKESGGQICQPSAKVRQTVHEQEEMVHHQNAKAQKDCECHHLLQEEGSENKDEDHINEGQDVEEDGFHEEEGTHIGHPIFFFLPH